MPIWKQLLLLVAGCLFSVAGAFLIFVARMMRLENGAPATIVVAASLGLVLLGVGVMLIVMLFCARRALEWPDGR
jgi:hypothetical protein